MVEKHVGRKLSKIKLTNSSDQYLDFGSWVDLNIDDEEISFTSMFPADIEKQLEILDFLNRKEVYRVDLEGPNVLVLQNYIYELSNSDWRLDSKRVSLVRDDFTHIKVVLVPNKVRVENGNV
jgi:hypothetical protein